MTKKERPFPGKLLAMAKIENANRKILQVLGARPRTVCDIFSQSPADLARVVEGRVCRQRWERRGRRWVYHLAKMCIFKADQYVKPSMVNLDYVVAFWWCVQPERIAGGKMGWTFLSLTLLLCK